MEDFRTRHALPGLGCGVGLRREFFDGILETDRRIDWLEVLPENFVRFGGKPRRVLTQCAERWTVLPHGVALNLGGPDPLDAGYLDALARLVQEVDAPFFSDHLSLSAIGGAQFQDLVPLPFTGEAVRHVAARIREASERVQRPFLLENPSYYLKLPGELDEASFLLAVAKEADCGLLLDVNNVFVNAQNHGYDPYAFLDRVPAGRVGQLHLAGHSRADGVIIDTHIGPIVDEVWRLYEHALRRFGPVSTLIEWDHEIPSLDAVLDEADRARARMQRIEREAA
ncbi:MAG: DUF692 domain-containing protein [Myxococcales bacterium]